MTDAEMVKAMEICKDKEIPCDDCPLVECGDCEGISRQYFYDRFKQLQSENAELKSSLTHANEECLKWHERAQNLLKDSGGSISGYEKKISDLQSENAALRERLEKAIELPCIEPMTTWDWDDTTGCGKSNFGKYWQVLYRDVDGEFIDYIGATKEEAEKRLAELKGETK